MGGRDAEAREVVELAEGAVGGDRRGQPALAVAEGPKPGQLRPGLGQQVLARDAQVGDAIPDELDHVVGPDEQDVEIEVPDAGDEASLMLLEHKTGIAEQLDGRLDETALVRDGQAEPFAPLERRHRSRPAA